MRENEIAIRRTGPDAGQVAAEAPLHDALRCQEKALYGLQEEVNALIGNLSPVLSPVVERQPDAVERGKAPTPIRISERVNAATEFVHMLMNRVSEARSRLEV